MFHPRSESSLLVAGKFCLYFLLNTLPLFLSRFQIHVFPYHLAQDAICCYSYVRFSHFPLNMCHCRVWIMRQATALLHYRMLCDAGTTHRFCYRPDSDSLCNWHRLKGTCVLLVQQLMTINSTYAYKRMTVKIKRGIIFVWQEIDSTPLHPPRLLWQSKGHFVDQHLHKINIKMDHMEM
jgi:hypothetical protein